MSRKGREFDHSHYQTWIDPKELIPYPKNAKQHDNAQVKNIANSIRRFGWQQEAVVTQDNVLVIGHGRRLAALMLKCEMPVKIIDQNAEDLTDEDIRELRIADNKTNESPWDFELLQEDLEGLEFEGFDFEWMDDESGISESGDVVRDKENDFYTQKTDIPQYTPSGDKPQLDELIDTEKYDDLICEIDNSGLPEEEKEFLRKAACRHIGFTYKKVADYYATASAEMQRLMEHSALVIIDYGDAIKKGYAVLSKTLMELLDDE